MTFCLQSHSCALSSGGAVSCWGYNGDGRVIFVVVFEGAVGCCGGDVFRADDVFFVQLGDGTTTTIDFASVVGLGSGVAMLALGDVRLGLLLPRGCCLRGIWQQSVRIVLVVLL